MKMFMALVLLFLISTSNSNSADFKITQYCPQCPGVYSIWLIGKIIEGDYERFRRTLIAHGSAVSEVKLRTAGGSVQEAIAIGRLIRSLFMETSAPIGREYDPRYDGCRSETRQLQRNVPCLCASACFFVFVGGVHRNGTEIFLHRIRFDEAYFGSLPPLDADKKYKEALRIPREYLAEMGVPDKYYFQMLRIPSGNSERISRADTYDFLREIPSFGEWLTAQCGDVAAGFSDRKNTEIGQCRLRKTSQARQDAFERFLREN